MLDSWRLRPPAANAPERGLEIVAEPPRGVTLGALGRFTSDGTLLQLEAIRAVQGHDVADDIASGYVNGAERFWQGENSGLGLHRAAE